MRTTERRLFDKQRLTKCKKLNIQEENWGILLMGNKEKYIF